MLLLLLLLLLLYLNEIRIRLSGHDRSRRFVRKYLLPDAVSTRGRTIARMIMAPTTTARKNPTRIFFVVHQLQLKEIG
jgi:hypothetical protein